MHINTYMCICLYAHMCIYMYVYTSVFHTDTYFLWHLKPSLLPCPDCLIHLPVLGAEPYDLPKPIPNLSLRDPSEGHK